MYFLMCFLNLSCLLYFLDLTAALIYKLEFTIQEGAPFSNNLLITSSPEYLSLQSNLESDVSIVSHYLIVLKPLYT